jgi:carbonic anhydrase
VKGLIDRLIEGNRRYAEGAPMHPRQDAERRAETAESQVPFAVVIGCSDSRVPPEIIFDQGIGDLFIIRTAGNILDEIGLASIEYAVLHLGVRLVVVLGHSRCGAVEAALEGGKPGGHLDSVIEALKDTVSEVRGAGGDEHDAASRKNVHAVVERIWAGEPALRTLIAKGELEVVGAYYDLDEGTVELPIAKGDAI